MIGDSREYLRHDAVATRVFQEVPLQVQQRFGHGLEWRTIAQGSRLLDDQRDVVLPVVEGDVSLEHTLVQGNLFVIGDDDQLGWVDARWAQGVGTL